MNRVSGFFNNIGSALLALILALIVWVVAVQQQDPLVENVYDRTIPITRIGPDQGVVPFGGLLERVQIRIRAPQSSWTTLAASNFAAQLDLRALEPGSYNIPLLVTSSDPRVTIVSRQPEDVSVVLEPFIEREMLVQVNITAQPSFSYYMPSPQAVAPMTVTVGGAKQLVEQVASAVAQVSLANVTAPVAVRRPVLLLDLQGGEISNGLTVEPPTVVVSATVEQRPGYRVLPVVPKRTGQPAPGYRYTSIDVEPPEVVVYGSPATIDTLPGYVGTAEVPIEGAVGDVSERVALELPENVSVVGDTQSVLVRIHITPLEDSITIGRSPVFLGLGEGLTATTNLKIVEIVLAGPVPRLNALTPGDVRVVLNLVGLEPGLHSLEPEVIVPEGLRAESVVPRTVPVEVRLIPSPTVTVTVTVTVTITVTPRPLSTPVAPPRR